MGNCHEEEEEEIANGGPWKIERGMKDKFEKERSFFFFYLFVTFSLSISLSLLFENGLVIRSGIGMKVEWF